MFRPRQRTVPLLIVIAAGISACSDLTGSKDCGYAGAVPGLTISTIDAATQSPPTAIPVITAVSSGGKTFASVGGTIFGDSMLVSAYIGPDTYTVTITTTGYESIDVGKVLISSNPDGDCAEPATSRIPITLTRTTVPAPR